MYSDMKGIVEYGNTKIQYSFKFSNRKTLAIEVHPNGDVLVVAPVAATKSDIQTKVEKRAAWITKQLRFFRAYPFNRNIPEWISGETIYYLGRQYRLKINEGDDAVKLQGKFLHVWTLKKSDTRKIKTLIEEWYHSHAQKLFSERIARFKMVLDREKIKLNKLYVRSMQKRWGSCTKQGNIVLNSFLVKAPVYCIDYVIVHEICHLKYHDHSPRFWAMLQKHCPEWSKAKERLEVGGWNG